MRLSPQTEQAMLNQGELASLLEIHNDGPVTLVVESPT